LAALDLVTNQAKTPAPLSANANAPLSAKLSSKAVCAIFLVNSFLCRPHYGLLAKSIHFSDPDGCHSLPTIAIRLECLSGGGVNHDPFCLVTDAHKNVELNPAPLMLHFDLDRFAIGIFFDDADCLRQRCLRAFEVF
jgi:hypothetical protein